MNNPITHQQCMSYDLIEFQRFWFDTFFIEAHPSSWYIMSSVYTLLGIVSGTKVSSFRIVLFTYVCQLIATMQSFPSWHIREASDGLYIAVDGRWSEWSQWSNCSATCGNGTTTRTRSCIGPVNGGKPCEGNQTQSKTCNNKCPGKYAFEMYFQPIILYSK